MGKKHKHEKHKYREREDNDEVQNSAHVIPKLIVKLGGATPEYNRAESPAAPILVRQDPEGFNQDGEGYLGTDHHHHHRHKDKKKKKKKDKKKSHEKGEREHRHHHKKKRKKDYPELEPQQSQSSVYYSTQSHSIPSVPSPRQESVSPDDEPAAKRICADLEQTHPSLTLSPRRDVPSRSCSQKPNNALNKILEYLLVMLEKKDINNFFSSPVSDTFAPGYSTIIKEPMDFSTMREKIEDAKYMNLERFRYDFELICTNCMTYNLPDTVYYKTAKKLHQQGQRIIAPERLRALAQHLPLMKDLSREELGFEMTDLVAPTEATIEDEKDVSKFIEEIQSTVKSRPPGIFESVPDQMAPDDILAQAKAAAKAAADKLIRSKVGGHMGYLKQKADGGTSLSLITPVPTIGASSPSSSRQGQTEKPVSLEQLVGKVKNGTSSLTGFKEDRRNTAKAIHPLYYGAFSSHGPTHDSTFANLTKAETELVYSTYGDDVGVSYAESIKNFSRNCEYATFIVDHLLDILTGDQHRKTSKYLEEQKLLKDEEIAVNDAFTDKDSNVDFDSLRSLEKDGIDMSFLGDLESKYNLSTDVKLETTAGLIEDLRNVQHGRLSGNTNLNCLEGPGEREVDLAGQVQDSLVDMVGSMSRGPRDLARDGHVSIQGVRRSLGDPL